MKRKMPYTARLVLLVLVCGLVATATFAQEDDPVTPEAEDASQGIFLHEGIERRYVLHVPPDHDPSGHPVPLAIVLHGANGTGRWMQQITAFDTVADEEGFIMLYPDAIEGRWNMGFQSPDQAPADDVGFLLALVDSLAEDYAIDPQRIYLTGFSDGATMSYRIACEHPERIGAVAGVSAPMAVHLVFSCSSQAAVSMLLIHGTFDPVLPWAGNEITIGSDTVRTMLSATGTLSFWAARNACLQDSLEVTEEPDLDPEDNTQVRSIVYETCRDNSRVVFYGIIGGGHTWPGHPFETTFPLGETSMDIDATAVIGAFFAQGEERHRAE